MLILMVLRPQYCYEVREDLLNRVGITEAHVNFLVNVPGILEIFIKFLFCRHRKQNECLI